MRKTKSRNFLMLLLILTLGGGTAIPSASAAESYIYADQWGGRAAGIAVDSHGNVYATVENSIQKFSSAGKLLDTWDNPYEDEEDPSLPGWIWRHSLGDIDIDSSGDVYAADVGNVSQIQKYSSTGEFLYQWDFQGAWPEGPGPHGIAVDSNRNVYAVGPADLLSPGFHKYSSTGQFLDDWGSEGTGDGQFSYPPADVAVDSSDNVYVVDFGSNRIQKFSSSGTFLTKWGSTGSGDGQFVSPSGIAVDSSGNVYVADSGNNRIQKFSSSGEFLTTWGSEGSGDGQFSYPARVAVDSSGNVYVADSGNNRIQKFSPPDAFVTGAGWIDSPAGAYALDPALSGKARFGFVSKYKKGATTPTGQTQFQFKIGNLSLKASAYEWLVVNGAKAQYKGAGAINGTGGYTFKLTVIDGQKPEGGGVDKFRIKIWDRTTGDVIYDNQMGAPDDADPTTVLGGGRITINKS